jgi:hypothetical protein
MAASSRSRARLTRRWQLHLNCRRIRQAWTVVYLPLIPTRSAPPPGGWSTDRMHIPWLRVVFLTPPRSGAGRILPVATSDRPVRHSSKPRGPTLAAAGSSGSPTSDGPRPVHLLLPRPPLRQQARSVQAAAPVVAPVRRWCHWQGGCLLPKFNPLAQAGN